MAFALGLTGSMVLAALAGWSVVFSAPIGIVVVWVVTSIAYWSIPVQGRRWRSLMTVLTPGSELAAHDRAKAELLRAGTLP